MKIITFSFYSYILNLIICLLFDYVDRKCKDWIDIGILYQINLVILLTILLLGKPRAVDRLKIRHNEPIKKFGQKKAIPTFSFTSLD